MVIVLAGLAEFERSLIRSRTSEGRARALREGVKFGRKPTLTADINAGKHSEGARAVSRYRDREDLQGLAFHDIRLR